MKILGVESSCDETAASIIEGESRNKKVKILTNEVASSLSLHSMTGGVIPEIAAREQLKYILPVIDKASKGIDYDAIAVSIGPGLIGSLLVGVETAKTMSLVLNKPIIRVNHLLGHIFANFIQADNNAELPPFPAIVLIVSGGHTDLVLMQSVKKIKWLGGTRDDAAGEALDKIGRLLGLAYPAGPIIENLAKQGDPKKISLPRPMIGSDDFDFSFSGLKTAVLKEVKNNKNKNDQFTRDVSASSQQAIVDVLIKKTIKAAEKFNASSIILSGGVSANGKLRDDFVKAAKNKKFLVSFPPKFLCTDNAAMIAAYAFYNYKPTEIKKIEANPSLYFC